MHPSNQVKKNQIVEIVFDLGKKKLRAQASDGKWVRFPNHLRTRGSKFLVSLRSTGSSYITVGDIQEITSAIIVR